MGPPDAEIRGFEETTRLVRLLAQLGVTDVYLTGREPLGRRDVPELIAHLAAIDRIRDIALTTNGSLLVDQGGGDSPRRGSNGSTS